MIEVPILFLEQYIFLNGTFTFVSKLHGHDDKLLQFDGNMWGHSSDFNVIKDWNQITGRCKTIQGRGWRIEEVILCWFMEHVMELGVGIRLRLN